MSYAIGYVIYGVPLSEQHAELISEWELSEAQDPETDEHLWTDEASGECGFTTVYSGNGDHLMGYCGVLLTEIDECNEIFLDEVSWDVTPSQKIEAEGLINKLHPKLKELNGPVGRYIVWGSS